MKRRNWRRRTGISLLGAAMAATALPAYSILPVAAEEAAQSDAQASSAQMVSDPEFVPVSEVGDSSRIVNFNANWKFALEDPAGADQEAFNDSSWEQVNLPHDYSLPQDYTPSGEAESAYKLGGTAWYRKTFTLNGNLKDKKIAVQFNGVYMDASVYINGHKLGDHKYGYTAFAFDLSEYLNFEGENTIAVRVNHQTPSSRWYSGSGIYRDVNLAITDAIHIGYNGVYVTTPNLAANPADGKTTVKTKVDNASGQAQTIKVRQTVLSPSGQTVKAAEAEKAVAAGASDEIAVDVAVENPTLWSLDNPALYTLKTEVLVGDEVKDSSETTFGYRYFAFDKNTGFSLNGEKMKLKGVCMHHDQGALGAEANDTAIARQVRILKEMGCNAIRVTHNPADPALLEEASKQGMLIINELFDGWIGAKNGNSQDFARFFNVAVGASDNLLNKQAGDTWAEFSTRAAVEASRNEPSVILYSLGNEIYEGAYNFSNQAGTIANNLISWVNEADNTRKVTFGGNQLKNNSSEDVVANAITAAGGVVGYNYAQGAAYDSARSNHSGWTIYGGETASHTNTRGVYDRIGNNVKADDKLLTSYDYSAVGWGAVASSAWYDIITRDFVAGEFVWTGFDYLGEPTPWNGTGSGYTGGQDSPKNSFFGIVDTAGLPKDSYYFYQSQWNDSKKTLHILPAWNSDVVYQDASGKTPVVVYTDAAEVELFFTPAGSSTKQSLGSKKFTQKTTSAGYTYQIYEGEGKESQQHRNLYLTWQVPYADGTISAEARDKDGNVIDNAEFDGNTEIKTAGAAAKLEAKEDRKTIKADGADLSYITIDVTDEAGLTVPNAQNVINVSVEGAGELAGLDNGLQRDHQSFQDSNRKAWAGKLVAIVRSNGKAGDITVKMTSNGLEAKTITLKAQADETAVPGDGLSGFEYSKNYYVKTGTMPELPAKITAVKADGSKEEAEVAWEILSAEQFAKAGIVGVKGLCKGKTVTISVNVLDSVAALLNCSAATTPGSVPSLPSSRPAVLADGTILAASFPVAWDMPAASAFAQEGTVVVNGTAEVFGESIKVSASVRVGDATITLGDSVTAAAELTQDIAADNQSDTLDAIKDGSVVYNPDSKDGNGNNTTCWSNYKNCWTTPENDTAQITFRYDTQQRIGEIVTWFVSDTWSVSYPDANTTKWEYSEDGTNWTTLETTETIGEETSINGTAGLGYKPYTYTFDRITPTYLRLTVKNTATKKANRPNNNVSTGISEVELKEFNAAFTMGNTAELASLSLDGEAVSADRLSKDEIRTIAAAPKIEAAAKDNGAVTVLPAENGKQKILVQSEDGSTMKVYTLLLKTSDPEDASDDVPVSLLTATAGSQENVKGNDVVTNALDGDSSTLWHSSWDGAPREDLWIELAMEDAMYIDGIRALPRQTQTNGIITKYRVDVLDADGTTWKTAATGDWAASDISWKRVSFEKPVLTKKVRVYAVESVTDTNKNYACFAELRLTKVDGQLVDPDYQDPQENVALHKTATASSIEADSVRAALATDGDSTSRNSRWGSDARSDAEWIYVDLGKNMNVRTIKIFWENRKALSYHIDLAADGANLSSEDSWKTVKNFDDRPKTIDEVIVLDQTETARYVRLSIPSHTSEDPDGGIAWNTVSIYEMEVYGGILANKPITDPKTPQEALNAIVVDEPAKGDTELHYTLPEKLPEGCELKYNGTDLEQVIALDGTIHQPVVDKTVKVSFKATSGDNVYFKEFDVTVPGKYQTAATDNAAPKVLPELQEWKGATGSFSLKEGSRLVYTDDLFKDAAEEMAADYKDLFGKELSAVKGTAASAKAGDIVFAKANDAGLGEEGYRMDVKDVLSVSAKEATGGYWATRSILQAMQSSEDGSIAKGEARDYPLYETRSVVLDVGRKTFTLDWLKDAVKLMSWFKLNDFQIHLNDNYIWLEDYTSDGSDPMSAYSGFRLESDIKKGGNNGLNQADLTSTDVFYTKDEFRSLIKESRKRGVQIVPEIDTPAHSLALTKVRPDLRNGTNGRENDHLNLVSKYDDSLGFVQSIFGEYMNGDNPVFDEETVVHIGADEYNASSVAYRKFVNDMIKYVEDSGRKARVWGSFTQCAEGEAINAEGVEINIWNHGYANMDQMYKDGFDLINCNDGQYYVVPNATYYYDWLNDSTVYNAKINQVSNVTSTYIPAGDPQMKGGGLAIWNDMIDRRDNGMSMYDIYQRILKSAGLYGANAWGKGSMTLAEAQAATEMFNTIPNTWFEYDQPAEGKEQMASLNMESLEDAENGVSLAGNIVSQDGRKVLSLGGSSLGQMNGLDTVGLGNSLRFKVKRTSASTDEQILFESEYGAIKAVQKGTGELGISRENRDFSFGYTLPVGRWVEIELRNEFETVSLYVNGELISTLGNHTRGQDKATVMFPVKTIGSKEKPFAGYIDDIRIGKSLEDGAFVSTTALDSKAAILAAVDTSGSHAALIKEAYALSGSYAPSADDVAAMIERIEAEIAKAEYEKADYKAVDAYLALVPDDLSAFTDSSASAVTNAVKDIERNLPAAMQSQVDTMAESLHNALENLVRKENRNLLLADQSTMTATASSSQTATEPGPASNAIDGDPSTMWHSAWNNTTMPHHLTIEFQEPTAIDQVIYTPRSGGGNGTCTKYRIEVSSDGTTFTPVKEGDLAANGDVKTIELDEAVTTKFVRMVFVAARNNNGSCAEINFRLAGVAADKDALNAVIAKADALKEDDFTRSTWAAMQAAKEAAKAVAAKEDAGAVEADEAMQNLRKAMAALELKDNPDTLNYTNLETVGKKLEGLDLEALSNTEALSQALAEYKAMMNNADTQKEINNKTREIHRLLLDARLTPSEEALESLNASK